jgi:hypothetical protein
VAEDGRVLLEDGGPLEAEYVVAAPGLRLDGRRLGSGTAVDLALWQVSGRVRVVDSTGETSAEGFCPPVRS